ncbi:12002_t:CDS:2, partial [Gigaspora margarita]
KTKGNKKIYSLKLNCPKQNSASLKEPILEPKAIELTLSQPIQLTSSETIININSISTLLK